MELILTIIGILGNVTAVLLFLSPLPTFWEIVKKRSAGSYSGVPYACTLGNCLLWVFYGLPIITRNNMLVITINGFGVALESLYLLIFIPCSKAKARARILSLVGVILAFYGAMIALTLRVVPVQKRAFFVGIIAVIFNTAMYAAPLAVMKLVIQSKSVESMPFLLSLCTLVNSCLWGLYGLIKRDPFIIIPNALGVTFGIMQMVLYGIYYKREKPASISRSNIVGPSKPAADHHIAASDHHQKPKETRSQNV